MDFEINRDKIKVAGRQYQTFHKSVLSSDVAMAVATYMYHAIYGTSGLYNINLYWPERVEMILQIALAKTYRISVSQHAEEEIKKLHLPPTCYQIALYGKVVEAEIFHGYVTKIVTRTPNKFKPGMDICMSVKLMADDEAVERTGFGHKAEILTVWENSSTDMHTTLDVSEYAQAPDLLEQAKLAQMGKSAPMQGIVTKQDDTSAETKPAEAQTATDTSSKEPQTGDTPVAESTDAAVAPEPSTEQAVQTPAGAEDETAPEPPVATE